MRILKHRLKASCTRCFSRSVLFDMALARLGDAVVNFLVSAALSLAEEAPQGVKASDQLLDKVYAGSLASIIGTMPRGYRGADVVEAFYGCLWLCGGLDLDAEVGKLASCLSSGSLESCLAERIRIHVKMYV